MFFHPLKTVDLPAVLEIEGQQNFPWPEQHFLDCLEAGYSCWVMEKERQIIGFGVLMLVSDEAEVLNIAIHPNWQRQGHGLVLLNFLIEKAHENGANTIFLEVRESNQKAIQLYHKAQFQEVGNRKDYYPAFSGRENAIIMCHRIKSEK